MNIKRWKTVGVFHIAAVIALVGVPASYLNTASDTAQYIGYTRSLYPFVLVGTVIVFRIDLVRANSLKSSLFKHVPDYLMQSFEAVPLTFFLGIKPKELREFKEAAAVSSEPDLIKNYFGLHKYLGV